MTTSEAAERLGVSRRRVGQLIEAGALTPLRRFGRSHVLDSADVERYAATVSGTR
jgi:excisionase family DNA binding protein